MNFKSTPLKSIISIVTGFLIGYLSRASFVLTVKPGGLGAAEYTYNWYGVITTGVIAVIIVYIVWSFFQKKTA